MSKSLCLFFIFQINFLVWKFILLVTFLIYVFKVVEMGDLQRQLFQKKLREAESNLGLNFSEDATEEDEVLPVKSGQSDTIKEKYEFPKWDQFFKRNDKVKDQSGNEFNTYYSPPKSNDSPIFIFHHGAGSSALSFGLLAKDIIKTMNDTTHPGRFDNIAGVFSFDCRGHGQTTIVSNPDDYSLDSFVNDTIFIINDLISRENLQTNSIFLVGHSLGGSILTKVCHKLNNTQVKGLIMFDIVEDTAVQALESMRSYVRNMPTNFKTLTDAVDYHLKSNLLRNKDSALVSVPHLVKYEYGTYNWVMDLNKTIPFWDTWFTGLSKSFVDAPTSKLLILAGTDSLDKELMIGQMQGKYQLIVFQYSGHFIQEDLPKKTSITLIDFWERNDRNQTTIKSTWGSKKS